MKEDMEEQLRTLEPEKLATILQVFDASNVSQLLQNLSGEERTTALENMLRDARAREEDPVMGSVGTINALSERIEVLQAHVNERERRIQSMLRNRALVLALIQAKTGHHNQDEDSD